VGVAIVVFVVVVILLALFFWAPWRGVPGVQLLHARGGRKADEETQRPQFHGGGARLSRVHHLDS
jgi:hypothetical protein